MLIAIWISLPLIVQGQGNLVPNGSFEDIVSCPTGTAQIHLAVPWLNDVGGVELYHGCNPGSSSGSPHVGVPANTTGHQYAHSGEGYAGIFAYGGPFEPEGREYLQVELTEPIQASVRYKVSFWASPADKYQYAVTSLGAYFSDTLMTRAVFNSVLDVEPSVENPADHPLADKDIWHMVTDTFNSRYGGERYLVIGNFRSAEESNLLWVDSGATQNHNRSYYYIDDISVIALDTLTGIQEMGNMNSQFKVYPNPNNGQMTLEYALEEKDHGYVTLYNIFGQAVINVQLSNERNMLLIEANDLSSGLYSVVVRINGKLRLSEKMSVLKE